MNTITALLIDDDLDDHLFFQMATEGLCVAINCEFAINCVQAIEKLKDLLLIPDIIFIDVNMPGMNGFECLAAIKKLDHLKAVPVYMYTTSVDPEITKRCIALGANDVVKKLPNIEQMRERFAKIFSSILLSATHG